MDGFEVLSRVLDREEETTDTCLEDGMVDSNVCPLSRDDGSGRFEVRTGVLDLCDETTDTPLEDLVECTTRSLCGDDCLGFFEVRAFVLDREDETKDTSLEENIPGLTVCFLLRDDECTGGLEVRTRVFDREDDTKGTLLEEDIFGLIVCFLLRDKDCADGLEVRTRVLDRDFETTDSWLDDRVADKIVCPFPAGRPEGWVLVLCRDDETTGRRLDECELGNTVCPLPSNGGVKLVDIAMLLLWRVLLLDLVTVVEVRTRVLVPAEWPGSTWLEATKAESTACTLSVNDSVTPADTAALVLCVLLSLVLLAVDEVEARIVEGIVGPLKLAEIVKLLLRVLCWVVSVASADCMETMSSASILGGISPSSIIMVLLKSLRRLQVPST